MDSPLAPIEAISWNGEIALQARNDRYSRKREYGRLKKPEPLAPRPKINLVWIL